MKLIYQIPRNSLAWLLLSYLAVIAPHVPRLPGWIAFAALICLVWRVQVYRGLWRFPPRWFKYLVAGFSVIGLIMGYGRLTGLEPMVALLIIGFSFKLLEMYQRRDALAVIFLAYLVAATELLFSQTIPATLYIFFTVLLITTGLMGLNQSQGVRYPARSLRLTLILLLQAVPLMMLLFVVMPRLGALWAVPFQQHSGITGVSDSMAPGDFTRLGRSGDLAFRVSFDGGVPDASKRYWRGLVFSRFDGRRWSQADPFDYRYDGSVVRWYGEQTLAWESLVEKRGNPLSYSLIMEPSQQIWLYSLATPVPQQQGVGLTRDFRLTSKAPIQKRAQFNMLSYPDHRTESQPLPDWRYLNETKLPPGFNPKTRMLAQQWRIETGSDRAYINRVLGWFNREFTYTLEPPALGKHTADEFLLETKRGFCEHFASSFTLMMRAAGIPARVVVGYQGGELNPYQNYLMVYQFDAHAWTEVWLEGQGWQRIDPTAAVAPERIENGLGELLDEESFLSGSPLSLVRYRGVPWINRLRLQLDRVDYVWHRWVLAFDDKAQTDLLDSMLGKATPLRIAIACILIGGVILGAIAFRLLLATRNKPDAPVIRYYRVFCRKLARLGLARQLNEVPTCYAQRVIRERPDLAPAVLEITAIFEDIAYGEGGRGKQFEKLVKAFKPTKGGMAGP